MHLRMLRELPQPATRPQPTAAQRAAILGAAKRSAPARRGPMRLTSRAGLAAVCLLVVAGWLLIRPTQPSATASPPPPWSTLVAIFLPEASPTAVATPAGPAATATPDPRGRDVIASVPPPSLAGNAIGEPLKQEVIVYLPPSYDQGNRRYPVVYALSPTTRKDANRFDTQGTEIRSAVALDLSAGMMPEMIIVVPDSLNALNATNFLVSSPTVGDWRFTMKSRFSLVLVALLLALGVLSVAADSRPLSVAVTYEQALNLGDMSSLPGLFAADAV